MENIKEELVSEETTEIIDAYAGQDENVAPQPEGPPTVILDASTQYFASSLITYTLSTLNEINAIQAFPSKREFKKYIEQTLRSAFDIFLPQGSLLDLDINISQDNVTEVSFDLQDGPVVITDTRVPVMAYVRYENQEAPQEPVEVPQEQ